MFHPPEPTLEANAILILWTMLQAPVHIQVCCFQSLKTDDLKPNIHCCKLEISLMPDMVCTLMVRMRMRAICRKVTVLFVVYEELSSWSIRRALNHTSYSLVQQKHDEIKSQW
jgi:hypothetical protein